MTKETAMTRDEIRSKIFGAKPKSEVLDDFFGTKIELRQPVLEVALAQRETTEEDRVYFMLTDYTFVPGTDDKVFEPADIAQLRKLPFGADFTGLISKVNKLLGLDGAAVEAEIKDAEKSA